MTPTIPHSTRIAAADDLSRAWIAVIAPARARRDPVQVAHQVILPDGPQAGQPLRPEQHPAQLMILRAIARDQHRRTWILGPVQDGKTLIVIIVILLWELFERGAHCVLCLPDLRLLAQLWRGKFLPVLGGSNYAGEIPDEGPGSSTGVPSDLAFRGGSRIYLMGAGGKNEAGQAGVTAKRVVFDEYSKIRRRQVAAARKRNESFGAEGREVCTSTISHDHHDPMWDGYQASSQGRMHVAFPCCGAYQTLEWDAVQYDGTSVATARASARIACVHCGTMHDDAARKAAILAHPLEVHDGQHVAGAAATATVAGEIPAGLDYGMRWTALDSPLRDLADLAAEHQQAIQARDLNADHEPLRQFTRDQLVMPYQAGTSLGNTNREGIARRSAQATYPRGTVPDGVTRIVVAIDVQRDRCYWAAVGALQARRALVDWGEVYWTRRDQEPTDADRHRVFDGILAQARDGWPRDDGRTLSAQLIGIDIGYESESVGRWVARHEGVLALRGDSDKRTATSLHRQYAGGLVEQRATAKPAADQPQWWWFTKTKQARELVRAGLQIGTDDPGSWLLPQGIAADSPIARHLTSWQLEPDEHGTPLWIQHGRRDDWLDDCCYAECLHRLLDDQHATGGRRGSARRTGRVGTYGSRNPSRHPNRR